MKKTVVVIERDSDILNIVEYILTERGYHVIPFQTEEGALQKKKKFGRPRYYLISSSQVRTE